MKVVLTEVGWVVAAEIVLIDSKVTLESSPCQTNFEIVELLGYEIDRRNKIYNLLHHIDIEEFNPKIFSPTDKSRILNEIIIRILKIAHLIALLYRYIIYFRLTLTSFFV